MNILKKLKEREVEVLKTEKFFRGFFCTEKGIVLSKNKDVCEEAIYFLASKEGKIFPCNNQTVYIASGTEYEGKIKSKEEAEQLAKEGKVLAFKSSDLYAEFYDFANNKELESCFKYGYSCKSRNYIEEIMGSIGLIRYVHVSDLADVDFEITKTFNLFPNPTIVGKEGDYWIAQTLFGWGDNLMTIKMHFSCEPTEDKVRTAFWIVQFEQNPVETFTCKECGKLCNWLELEGDIKKKYHLADDRYCGC